MWEKNCVGLCTNLKILDFSSVSCFFYHSYTVFFSNIIATTVDTQFQYIVYINFIINCEFECVAHQTAQLTGLIDEALHANFIAKSKIFSLVC